MRILVTNDDGIDSPGIRALAEVAATKGQTMVFAPNSDKSACGHAMTLHDPIRILPAHWEDIPAYKVAGVPVDCINVGLISGFHEGCELVLSGFNNGPNLGFDTTYSGTVAGAMEGALHGIKSIALSMGIFSGQGDPFFETGARWLQDNWEMLLNMPIAPPGFLSINIPAIPYEEIKGFQITHIGQKFYEGYLEQRHDPWSKPYYWYRGEVIHKTYKPGTDVYAVFNGYVSITPLTPNWTDHGVLEKLETYLSSASLSSKT
jgi:5'-nucleotidase